jgi:hypothetical protein
LWLENKKGLENKKPEYELEEEECYGNIQPLYTQDTQVRFCISSISNDEISTKRKKSREKGYCHLCGCKGIIVEKFPSRGYSSKSSYA